MKKILSVLLVFMLLALLFAGCKNSGSENSDASKSEPDKIEIISQTADIVVYDDGTLTDY